MNTVTSRCLHLDLSALVAVAGARRVVDPVQDDEGQAADHEHDSHHQKDGRLRGETPGIISRLTDHFKANGLLEGALLQTHPDLLWGAQRHRLDQAQVEGSR